MLIHYEGQTCETDCLTAAAAMVASTHGFNARNTATLLRRRLKPCERGGAFFVQAATVLRSELLLPVYYFDGAPLERALRLADRGAVALGIDPAVFEGAYSSDVGHAVLALGRVIVQRGRRLLSCVRIVDPSQPTPTNMLVVEALLERAYRAAGAEALWLPRRDIAQRLTKPHQLLRSAFRRPWP